MSHQKSVDVTDGTKFSIFSHPSVDAFMFFCVWKDTLFATSTICNYPTNPRCDLQK